MSFVGSALKGSNPMVAGISIVAAIGGFLFGYDTGVISGALLFIKGDLHASNFEQQAIVGSLLIGAMVGAAASGYLADAISRRWTKVLGGSVYVLGALGSAVSQTVPELIAARFVLGLAVGTASFVSPMYISELAPKKLRGGFTSFNQLMITSGILVAYIADWALKGVSGNWRWMLGLGAIPGAALAIGMLFMPYSPRWLVDHGRDDEARDVLRRVRGRDDVDEEVDEIREASKESGGVRELASPRLRRLMVIGLGLAIFQQIVGVNTVIYYAPTILQFTGLQASGAITQALLVGVTNVVFTIVAILLLDRVGRRALLIVGTVGLTIALAALGAFFASSTLQNSVGWLALVALVVYIASFAVGLGPVFWLMISEIYPLGVRSAAMSVSTIANWGANFLVAFTFLTLTGAITKQGTFWLYAGIGVVACVFFWVVVPETRGKSLEEVQAELTSEDDDHAREHAGRTNGRRHLTRVR